MRVKMPPKFRWYPICSISAGSHLPFPHVQVAGTRCRRSADDPVCEVIKLLVSPPSSTRILEVSLACLILLRHNRPRATLGLSQIPPRKADPRVGLGSLTLTRTSSRETTRAQVQSVRYRDKIALLHHQSTAVYTLTNHLFPLASKDLTMVSQFSELEL